jgi:hypothetical protein
MKEVALVYETAGLRLSWASGQAAKRGFFNLPAETEEAEKALTGAARILAEGVVARARLPITATARTARIFEGSWRWRPKNTTERKLSRQSTARS